jgi:hypothetical protein
MLDKKSNKGLGLFVLGIFLVLLIAGFGSAIKVGDPVDDATAKTLGYSDASDYANSNGGNSGLTSAEASKLGISDTVSSTPSKNAVKGTWDKVIVRVKGWFGGSGTTTNPTPGYSNIFGLTKAQATIVSHILLGILFLIIIFTIVEVLPFFPSNGFVKFLVSIIVTVLAMMLLPAADIEAVMGTYQALGIVLTSIVPFLVMLAFTIKWDERHPQYRFVSTIIWIGFVVYLALRWKDMPADATLKWAYPITLLLAILFVLFKGWFVKMAIRSGIKGDFAKFDRLTRAEMKAEVALVDEKIKALKGKAQTPSVLADIEELEDKKKALVKGVVNAS